MEEEKRIRDKLKSNPIIKNYIEICKILEVEPTKGKGRKYHIQELERYCNYKKEGHKFIIREVFDEPLPKIDNRGKHLQKYDDLFDNLIIEKLIEYDGHIVDSYSSLMKYHFNFFNEEYEKLYKVGYARYSQIHTISKGLVMTYQQKIKEVIETALKTSLNRLQRQGIIKYYARVLVKDRNLDETYADKLMLSKIKKEEAKAYEKLNMTPFQRVNPQKNRQFKNEVQKSLQIASYYNVYDIKLIKHDLEIKTDEKELISRFIKSVARNTRNKTNQNEFGEKYCPYSFPKFDEDIDKLTRLLWKLPKGYMTDTEQDKLLITLFGNDTEDIIFEDDTQNYYYDDVIPFWYTYTNDYRLKSDLILMFIFLDKINIHITR